MPSRLVLKLSGKVLEENSGRSNLAFQVFQLTRQGEQVVVVHGGGKQLTELSRRLSIPVVQYEGRRVTDESTLEVAKMVLSAINRDLTASLMAASVPAVGISSFDGGLVSARRRPPIRVSTPSGPKAVDFGLVGEIQGVDPSLIHTLWEHKMVPVISCLSADDQGQILNINADTLAAEISVAVGADALLSVSDVDGIYLDLSDPSSKIERLTVSEAQIYLRQGRFTDGMIPKVEVAIEALRRGVRRVQVVSGMSTNSLLEGARGRSGTALVAENGNA
ncbi:MAG: acetylglutamate kinase [Acidobacteria bacterium]|nr:acetylglutamate kinase [Acidobacteriota bacterium]